MSIFKTRRFIVALLLGLTPFAPAPSRAASSESGGKAAPRAATVLIPALPAPAPALAPISSIQDSGVADLAISFPGAPTDTVAGPALAAPSAARATPAQVQATGPQQTASRAAASQGAAVSAEAGSPEAAEASAAPTAIDEEITKPTVAQRVEGALHRAGRWLSGRSALTPEELFLAGNPSSQVPRFLAARGMNFDEVAGGILRERTFVMTRGQTMQRIVPEEVSANERDRIKAVFTEIFDFADKAEADPLARQFLILLGRKQAHLTREHEGRPQPLALPHVEPASGEYWDLATGFNGRHLMQSIAPGVHYKLFDVSPLVVAFLKEYRDIELKAGNADAANIEIVEQDVRTLQAPSAPLQALRVKNVYTYVDGFEKDLERMLGWIGEGGMLVLQNDPHAGHMLDLIQTLGPLIERLISEGWEAQVRISPYRHAFGMFDTVALLRPRAGDPAVSVSESRYAWEEYKAAAQEFAIMEEMLLLGSGPRG